MKFQVVAVLEASSACVSAEVRTDASGLLEDPSIPTGAREFVRLYPAGQEQRASGLNPTAWVVDQFPVTLDGSVPDIGCDR